MSETIVHPKNVDTSRIWAACWPEPIDARRTKEMPHYTPMEPEDVLMLHVDGEAVSCTSYARRQMLVGEARLPFGCLGNVATKTEHQRRGYASRLIERSVHEMRQRGDLASGLFCFGFEYYQRFGWATAGDYWSLLIMPEEYGQETFTLPAFTAAGQVRRYHPGDAAAMSAIYEEHLNRRGWGLVRPAGFWRWLESWLSDEICVVHESQHGLDGYLIAESTPRPQLPDEFTFRRNDAPLWPAEIGPVAHIVEMVTTAPASRQALVGHLAGQVEAGRAIAYPLASRFDLQALGLLAPPARVQIWPSWMFRVIDAPGAMQALIETDAVQIEEPISFGVQDQVLGESASFALVPERGNGSVALIRERTVSHHLRLGIEAFSQLYAGYRRATDLLALGQIEATSSHAATLADQAFVVREPFVGELDLW
jgi:predicted acetyltransferase